MMDLFGTASMAAGYARSRPAVHPHVIERVRTHLGLAEPLFRALDVGCGAGLSTRPLARIARRCVGLDPAPAMVRGARQVASEASFLVGRAEALPVRSRSTSLITAAGSLNWVDLDSFLPEAARVLVPEGTLVVYDFFQGREFRDSQALRPWFADFTARYPLPHDSGHEVSPASLASTDRDLRLEGHEEFEIGLPFTAESYCDYVMTETNVSHAVARGASEHEIRAWCTRTLAPVFAGATRDVLFAGYIAYLSAD